MRTVADPRSTGSVIEKLAKEHVVPQLQVGWLSVELVGGQASRGVVGVISAG
jgi:hypothetical protein